jgi:Eukaryotic cytochrome b561
MVAISRGSMSNRSQALTPFVSTHDLCFSWFHVHTIFQLFFAGPVIFAGWSQGQQVHGMLKIPHLDDNHKNIGVVLMILYIAQLVIGLFIHYIKFPSLFKGRRPPQNYVHVLLGLAILALAAYEVSSFSVHFMLTAGLMSSFRCT